MYDKYRGRLISRDLITTFSPTLVLSGRLLNGCRTGQSKITRGYDLPAFVLCSAHFSWYCVADTLLRLYVIHTVGPIYSSKEKEERAEQLASAYKTSLEVAVENSIRHVVGHLAVLSLGALLTLHQAFPSISTGIYSYPVPAATRIALNEVRTFLESEDGDKVGTLLYSSSSDLEILKQLERIIFVVWGNQDKSVYEWVPAFLLLTPPELKQLHR